MYKLRADVAIADSGLSVVRGLGDTPDGAFADPRHPALGWRSYGGQGGAPAIDWDAIRVAACVPETGVELIPTTATSSRWGSTDSTASIIARAATWARKSPRG
jgi:hypothetical protein